MRTSKAIEYQYISTQESNLWWYNELLKVANKEWGADIPLLTEQVEELQRRKAKMLEELFKPKKSKGVSYGNIFNRYASLLGGWFVYCLAGK